MATSKMRTVLFVDDEPKVLEGLRRSLFDYSKAWNMIFAPAGDKALEILERQSVDVVVTDQRMPGMCGMELLGEFQKRDPRVVRILLTGNTDQDTATAAINQGKVFRFFTKPCPTATLVDGINQAIQQLTEQEDAEKAHAEDLARNNAMLKTLVEDLTEANQQLERLSFIAAHDMREPLRQIASYTQMLERRFPNLVNDEMAEYFHFIVAGVKRMDGIVQGFSNYTQAITDEQNITDVSISHVCALVLERLSHAIVESGAQIRVDELPVVIGCPRAITQLLHHIIGNAIKFKHPEVSPEIRISVAESNRDWTFSVADNGIGIETTSHNIFDIFRRIHRPGAYDGHGVGLAICKGVVRRHGGRIWYEPNPSGGTVFYFTLPKKSAQALQ